jgi:copper resistance protein D
VPPLTDPKTQNSKLKTGTMDYWLALIRFVHIGGSVLLAAVLTFRLIVLKPAIKAERGAVDKSRLRFEDFLSRLAFVSLIIVILSGAAWLWLVAASISGEPVFSGTQLETLETILFQAHFGRLWLFRFACCLGLGILLLMRNRGSISAGLAILILASLGGAGHAGANPSSLGPFVLGADVGHLVIAAIWPGGLVPLLLFLCKAHRLTDHGDLVVYVVRRFSAMSLTAVALLGTTGLINAYFLVGSFEALFDSNYGRLLLFKIVLFVLMIGFGAVNLLVLKPRLMRPATVEKQAESPKLIAALFRNVMCEAILAAGVLLIVGLLGVTPPPMH